MTTSIVDYPKKGCKLYDSGAQAFAVSGNTPITLDIPTVDSLEPDSPVLLAVKAVGSGTTAIISLGNMFTFDGTNSEYAALIPNTDLIVPANSTKSWLIAGFPIGDGGRLVISKGTSDQALTVYVQVWSV